MKPACRDIPQSVASLVTFLILLISGCGGGGGGSSNIPTHPVEWVVLTSTYTTPTTATLNGTSWVSQDYYASQCVGLGCLLDTTRTDDYPGVDVTYTNLTTGASGAATSYYGPGTGWTHTWTVGVPVTSGSNTIRISAYDPGGQGGSITIDVVAPLAPLDVQSTLPAPGATVVPVNSSISATFNDLVDPQSVTSASFSVTGPSGVVSGSHSVNHATVSFTPDAYLAYDTAYTVNLTTALTGINGQALSSDYSWTFTAGYTPGEYRAVWGSSATDVFIVGFGPILHYDGKGLIDMTAWDANAQFNQVPFFHTLHGVWGSSGSDVFAVGDYGTILHFDGSAWSAMASGTQATLVDVWGSSAGDVFAVGYLTQSTGAPIGTVLHYDGSTWSVMSPSPPGGLYGVWGSAGSDVFVAGVDTILHFDGNTWTAMDPGTSNVQLLGIWGNSGNDVFAAGNSNTILHFDGNTWTAMQPAPAYYMHGVWGSSANSIFAVGDSGTILHFDGNTWTTMAAPGAAHELFDVWGSSDSDVYTVGSFSGVIFRYDGSTWSTLP